MSAPKERATGVIGIARRRSRCVTAGLAQSCRPLRSPRWRCFRWGTGRWGNRGGSIVAALDGSAPLGLGKRQLHRSSAQVRPHGTSPRVAGLARVPARLRTDSWQARGRCQFQRSGSSRFLTSTLRRSRCVSPGRLQNCPQLRSRRWSCFPRDSTAPLPKGAPAFSIWR